MPVLCLTLMIVYFLWVFVYYHHLRTAPHFQIIEVSFKVR